MNYQAIYTSLCLRGQEPRYLTGRVERHHIKPRHVGGDNDPINMTTLTPKEHLLAHRLLYRMYGRWQDKLAFNAMAGKCPDAKSLAQSYSGFDQYLNDVGIHSQSKEERSQFGQRLSEWNKLHPEGMQRGLDKCHDRTTQLKMARSKSRFVYVDPRGVEWLSRVEAAEYWGVAAFSIENWGKRGHYGWKRFPV